MQEKNNPFSALFFDGYDTFYDGKRQIIVGFAVNKANNLCFLMLYLDSE